MHPPLTDDWELESDLRQAQWLLQRSSMDQAAEARSERRLIAVHAGMRQEVSRRRRGTNSWVKRLCGAVLWLVLCLGAMVLTFGAGLLGCTIAGIHADLWNWGLLTALAGQLILFLGLGGLLALRATSRDTRSPPTALRSRAMIHAAPHFEAPSLPWSERCTAALSLPPDGSRA
jgi:hypothetical protein